MGSRPILSKLVKDVIQEQMRRPSTWIRLHQVDVIEVRTAPITNSKTLVQVWTRDGVCRDYEVSVMEKKYND